MTSLNPVYRVGWQIEEQLHAHERLARRAARARAIELLGAVGIPSAAQRIDDYPHQFSGGMRQRVMIAIALACNPDLLIADEPTTALDVTIQAQILTLIDRLKGEFGSAVIVITHDMGVVAQIAETVAVMYGGKIVEQGGVDAVFASPQHPYAWGLLGSIPRLDRPKPARLPTIRGLPPSLIDLPEGCAFFPRCDHAHAACRVPPELLPAQRARPPRSLRAVARAEGRAAAGRHSRREPREHPQGRTAAAGHGARQALPGQVGGAAARDGARPGRRRRRHRGARRRDARSRGRVGLRQVDARPLPRAPARPDRRHADLRRTRHLEALAPRPAPAAARAADRLPGSVRVAEPAQAGRLDHRLARSPGRARAAATCAGACRT